MAIMFLIDRSKFRTLWFFWPYFGIFITISGVLSVPVGNINPPEEDVAALICNQVCIYDDWFQRARCDDKRLHHVPISTGCENAVMLELQENDIEGIDIETMSGYTDLKTLDVSTNDISQLEPGVFVNNNHLKNLLMSHNKMTILRNRTFLATEQHLTRIYLDNNELVFHWRSCLSWTK